MFRFYKITTFADGTQWIDVGSFVSLQSIRATLESYGPLEVDAPSWIAGARYSEFLIFEG